MCADDICVIQRFRANQRKEMKPLFMIFLEVLKTFDRVSRSNLFSVLRSVAIPEQLVRAIEALYVERKVIIRLSEVITGPLPYDHDIIQGDVLSALLFIIYVNQISLSLNELDFVQEIADHLTCVDDFCLLTQSNKTAQKRLDVAQKRLKPRIMFNLGKCAVLAQRTSAFDLTLRKVSLAQVENYRYFGVTIAKMAYDMT